VLNWHGMVPFLRLLCITIALACTGVCQRYQTAGLMTPKQTLAGQPSISVAVEMGSIPASYSFQRDIENGLRQAGISVLPANAFPVLRFVVAGTVANQFQPPQLNYRVTLDFVQVFAANGRTLKGSTWSAIHTGLTPWSGISSAPDLAAQARRDALSMLNDFLDDWREVNGVASSVALTRLFDGVWRGGYSCPNGTGQSTWKIQEVRAGKVQADEQWVRFLSGHNSYTGTINGRSLEVKTEDMGGYLIQFRLSDDGRSLSGRYVGHPNGCQTVSLRKAE
jgi:hypothetical protein